MADIPQETCMEMFVLYFTRQAVCAGQAGLSDMTADIFIGARGGLLCTPFKLQVLEM